MKYKVSITLDEETIASINSKLREGLFRNRSHVIEYAVKSFLVEKNA